MESPRQVKRRKTHSRSKTGCLTCRQRHKRCDEQYLNGACERCRWCGSKCERPFVVQSPTTTSPPSVTPTNAAVAPLAVDSAPIATSQLSSGTSWPAVGSASSTSHIDASASAPRSSTAGEAVEITGENVLDFILGLEDSSLADLGFLLPWPESEAGPSGTTAGHEHNQQTQSGGALGYVDGDGASTQSPTDTLGAESDTARRVEIPDALIHDPDVSAAFLVALRHQNATEGAATFDADIRTLGDGSLGDVSEGHGQRWEIIARSYQAYQKSWRKDSHERVRDHSARRKTSESPIIPTTRGAVVEALRSRAGAQSANSSLGAVFHDFAMSLLKEPGCVSLSDALHAVCDLQAYNYLLAGAEACYKALQVAELLVSATLGPQPVLDLDEAVDAHDVSLIMFAESNLCRALTTERCRPLFALAASDIMALHRRSHGDVVDDRTFTVPLAVHEVLHRICCAAVRVDSTQGVDRAVADALDRDVRALFNEPTVPKVWSRAATIVLYQRLHRAGPLHPLVRAMAWDIIMSLDPAPCHKSEVFPLFLAGTVAILETQRLAVVTRWVQAPEVGLEEPLVFLKQLWEEVTRTGGTIHWLSFKEQGGVSLAFF